jgi:hypothetical protein
MTPVLSFDEIKNGELFEDLVASYFKMLSRKSQSHIVNVDVKPSGIGPDGGSDILVKVKLTDSIADFSRVWVVQCKFHNRNISPQTLADINIPTLIHSYKASGYLLICKHKPTSKLTELFHRLGENCQHTYKYEVWSGEMFKTQLLVADEALRKQYFPKYYAEEQALLNIRKK